MKYTKDITLIALLTVILFLQEQILSFIPNVQLTVFFFVLYSKKLDFVKTILIGVIYVILDNIIGGFNLLFLPFMLLGWLIIPMLINTIFKKVESNIYLALLGILFSLIYSWINIIPGCIMFNMTPIGGFCLNCIENDEYCSYGYGLDITTFNISGFTANFDPFYHGIDFGTEDEVLGTEYKIVSTDQHTFKLDKSCKEQKKSVLKSKNHCYIEIKDVECQTKFDLGFGGYMHCVYFNTSINLDFIYRVDVNYNLASDDKPFYNFIAKDGSMDVAKSLSPEIANGGFLGLGRYQGLTTGTFRSIQDNSKVYKYRLILNYDADGWNIFKGGEDESKYTNVHKFRMLRMNFIYNGEQYEEEIQMDAIEGDTLSFFDKEEIINVDSNYWEFRNGVNNIQDTLFGDKTKNVLLGVVGVLSTIILVYVFLKLYRIFKKLFQTKE